MSDRASRPRPIRDAADERGVRCGQVLDELVDGPVHLAGTSFGGWLALNLARRQPKHVRSVVRSNRSGRGSV